MRSRLRLIGKKIALARRLVSLLTCTQHLRLKYRIHAGLSLALPLSHLSLVQTRRSLALASPRRSSYTHQRAATSSRSFPPPPPSTSPPLLALSSIAYGRSINPFCMILPVRETRRDIASRRFPSLARGYRSSAPLPPLYLEENSVRRFFSSALTPECPGSAPVPKRKGDAPSALSKSCSTLVKYSLSLRYPESGWY